MAPVNRAFICLLLLTCSRPVGPPPERSEEIAWVAEYMGYACGEFTPELMPVDVSNANVDLSKLKYGLMFYVPPGFTAPDQLSEVGVPGNRFLIRGHYYYHERSGRKLVVPRFDLLGWQPLPPFRRWEENGSRSVVENPQEEYSQFESQGSSKGTSFQIAGNYSGC